MKVERLILEVSIVCLLGSFLCCDPRQVDPVPPGEVLDLVDDDHHLDDDDDDGDRWRCPCCGYLETPEEGSVRGCAFCGFKGWDVDAWPEHSGDLANARVCDCCGWEWEPGHEHGPGSRCPRCGSTGEIWP